MVRWLRWHCPPDTGFEIRALAVWGRARYLSVTEAPHNTNFYTWMGKKQFCFFQTAETGNRTPDSGVKGSGADHYPRAPAQMPIKRDAFGQQHDQHFEPLELPSPIRCHIYQRIYKSIYQTLLQTRDINPMLGRCWATVCGACPTLIWRRVRAREQKNDEGNSFFILYENSEDYCKPTADNWATELHDCWQCYNKSAIKRFYHRISHPRSTNSSWHEPSEMMTQCWSTLRRLASITPSSFGSSSRSGM